MIMNWTSLLCTYVDSAIYIYIFFEKINMVQKIKMQVYQILSFLKT